MLVPSGLSKKEREAYDKIHVPKSKKFLNRGPRAGLRPVGGGKSDAKTSGKK